MKKKPNKQDFNFGNFILVLGIVVFVVVFIGLCSNNTSSNMDTSFNDLSCNACNLATIDAGYKINANDERVIRIQNLLDTIRKKTPDTELTITDRTAQGVQVLKKDYGISMTNLELLQEMNKFIQYNNQQKYEQLMAEYIILKTSS